MPAPLELFWLIPVIPFLGALTLASLLISFNRTMNRLTKPVSFITISSVGISTAISYLILYQELGLNTINDLSFIYKIANFEFSINFIIDKFSAISESVLCTLLIIYMIYTYFSRYGKKGQVRLFVILGFTASLFLAIPLLSFTRNLISM